MALPVDLRQWTKEVLAQYQLRAGKRRGQHFLVDRHVLDDTVASAAFDGRGTMLEVGAGLGTLTLALVERCRRLVAVELEPQLAAGLGKMAAATPQLIVVRGDIRKLSDRALLEALALRSGESFDVVANLPYNISGVFLRRFLTTTLPLRRLVLLLQQEIAERLLGHRRSLLTVLAWLTARVRLVRTVGPESFWPRPAVRSALVVLNRLSRAEQRRQLVGLDPDVLWRVARVGFASRRKQLQRNLVAGLRLPPQQVAASLAVARLAPTVRAEELSLGQWVKLAQALPQAHLSRAP